MQIPVFELKRQFSAIKTDIEKGAKQVLNSGFYILGKNVAEFEQEFARYCGIKYAVGCASGSDALKISLQACGIKEGQEVITTPFTFVATTEAIHSTGAKIVFADIDPDSYDIDPKEIEKKITAKTSAILCVHLYGQPCDMQAIEKIALRYGLKLIEDCAQATGAEYKKKKVGTFGDAGCFSFYPTKNLGAYGDGGMIITNDRKIAEKSRMLRVHGSPTKYEHLIHGYNSRLDELQAVILRTKLKYLDKWNQARRENAEYYNQKLARLARERFLVLPWQKKDTKHVYHLYVVRTKKRDSLIQYLRAAGISTAVHYPIPLHLQKVYKDLKYKKGDFPQSEAAAREIISLPFYPELKNKEIDQVVMILKQFFGR